MRERPNDAVTRDTFRPAPTTPRIRLSDSALDERPIGFKTLPDRFEAELIETAERGQVRGGEGSVRHEDLVERNRTLDTLNSLTRSSLYPGALAARPTLSFPMSPFVF